MDKDTSSANIKFLRGQDQKPTDVQNDLFYSFPIDCVVVPHAGTRLSSQIFSFRLFERSSSMGHINISQNSNVK